MSKMTSSYLLTFCNVENVQKKRRGLAKASVGYLGGWPTSIKSDVAISAIRILRNGVLKAID